MNNDYKNICNIISDKCGDRCAEEVIGLTTSLDDSVEEFVKQFEGEDMSDAQLAIGISRLVEYLRIPNENLSKHV